MHLFLIHARLLGQSVFKVHSGLHPSYGFPMKSGRHSQEPALFCSRHIAFEPHGLGMQGVDGTTAAFGILSHLTNGFPVKPIVQTHIAVWLTTRHSAFSPHTLTHGLLHFWFIQALSLEHSAFDTHSGLQLGGEPTYSLKQEHDGKSPITLHSEYGPQGEG